MEKMATRDAYGKALVELGKINKDVVVLDADLSGSTKTAGFAKEFPERFFNMGIAEQNLMGTAAGFAASGKIPFASTFAIFACGRAYDQIRNTIGYPKLNVKIAASHAGLTVGEDGGSHQMLEDISLMRTIPGMTVIVPADGVKQSKLFLLLVSIRASLYWIRTAYIPIILMIDIIEIGKASLLKEGKDVAIIATGIMVAEALEAAKELEAQGIEAAVLNISTIKPLDKEAIIQIAQKTGAVVTAEEHNIIGGLGSAVSEVLVENYPVPMERIGVQDTFVNLVNLTNYWRNMG